MSKERRIYAGRSSDASAEEPELRRGRGRRLLGFEASIAAHVDHGNAGALEGGRDQDPSMTAGWILLGAHDRGPACAREAHQPLDAGVEVGRLRAALEKKAWELTEAALKTSFANGRKAAKRSRRAA